MTLSITLPLVYVHWVINIHTIGACTLINAHSIARKFGWKIIKFGGLAVCLHNLPVLLNVYMQINVHLEPTWNPHFYYLLHGVYMYSI